MGKLSFRQIHLAGTEFLGKLLDPYFNREYNHFCSHCHTPAEKESKYPAVLKSNSCVYFSHPVFSMYHRHGVKAYKQMVINSLKLLMEDKIITTNAPTTAHINMNYQTLENRYVVHLLHYIPERCCLGLDTIEDIIPLYNVNLKVKLKEIPKKVYCAPSLEGLKFIYKDGYAQVIVPDVIGHQMVVFE